MSLFVSTPKSFLLNPLLCLSSREYYAYSTMRNLGAKIASRLSRISILVPESLRSAENKMFTSITSSISEPLEMPKQFLVNQARKFHFTNFSFT